MNTDRLQEFLVLSRTLSFSKAAAQLYLSQSILTRHIQSLEAELGVTLLERTTHGAVLTEAGKILARQGPSLLEKCGNTLALLKLQDLPVRGRVQIACEVEISYAAYIRSFISQFMARYPDIEVYLEIKPESALPEVVRDYDFLFTPVACQALPQNTVQHLIYSHGTYAALPPGHSLMTQSLIALNQLAGETIIVPYAGEELGPYAQNYLLALRSTQGRLSRVKAPNLSTALFLVSIRRGIALVPRYAKNMLPPETFIVGISDRSCRFNEYLYYHQRPENGAAKLFYEEFRHAYIRT